jgi:hypothetical protein
VQQLGYMKKLFLILTAALGLAISAQARLGWTLSDCENSWGSPVKVQYNPSAGKDGYLFRASPKLYVEVYFLGDCVQSVVYSTKDAHFLVDSIGQLLQKNLSGNWTLYDDGRGKKTAATWQYIDGNGALEAYALLWNYPDPRGFYQIQVSTENWNAYLGNRNVDQYAGPDDNLNI